jgi:hypothetical protein
MTEFSESARMDRSTPPNGEELAAVAAAVRMALEKTGHGRLR